MVPRLEKAWVGALLVIALLTIPGCEKLTTEYGSTQGRSSLQSIAGFGVMRQYFRNRDWDDRTVIRLSERQESLNTIVYIPTEPESLGQPAVDWFDDWLKSSNKTLIYVLRDYQTEDAYWKLASPLAPANQRLEYRRRSARANQAKTKAFFESPNVISEGWFTYVRPSAPSPFRGWVDLNRVENPGEETVFPLQYPHELEWQVRSYISATDDPTSASALPGVSWGFQGPGVSQVKTQVDPWLTTENDETIVLRVTSKDWPNSQILVVAGGSLLTNLGLIDPESQRLLATLEQWTFEDPAERTRKIGFLTAGPNGVNVSSLSDAAMNTSGMEAFTTWPLNVVSLHLAVVGIMVCLVLFPVLGRPRRLAKPSKSDFADHINAVATLLAKTEGEQYARVRISEYMVRVRGETSGPWVIPAPPPPIIPATEVTQTDSAQSVNTQTQSIQTQSIQTEVTPSTEATMQSSDKATQDPVTLQKAPEDWDILQQPEDRDEKETP